MNDFKRQMALQFYEESGNKNAWGNLEDFDLGEIGSMTWRQFELWLDTKKILTKEKVVYGLWKKVSDNGNTCIMRFSRDGTYIEHNIKTEKRVERGKWEITGLSKSLQVTIVSKRQGKPIEFILEILGDHNGNYAGVETRDDQLSAYFTVYHLK